MLTKCRWLSTLILAIAMPVMADTATLEVSEPEHWGEETDVVQISRLYLSGQPDQAALETAHDRGVDIVISLRDPSESDWDEQSAVTDLGLEYFQVPVDGKAAKWDDAAMIRISEIVQTNEDSKILVHCSSGNRAGAWLAYHLAADHGMNTDESIALAKKAGLTKESIEQKLRESLDNDGGSALSAD